MKTLLIASSEVGFAIVRLGKVIRIETSELAWQAVIEEARLERRFVFAER
jgi:hypothetical protein